MISASANVIASLDRTNLKSLFHTQLQDLYWAEQKLVKTFPKLRDTAISGHLKTAFNEHLQQTKVHVTRLEAVFQTIGEPAVGRQCPTIDRIAKESDELAADATEDLVQQDMALLCTGQKAEHYEIATYDGLIMLAKALDYTDLVETLEETLAEEEANLLLLNFVAQQLKYDTIKENIVV